MMDLSKTPLKKRFLRRAKLISTGIILILLVFISLKTNVEAQKPKTFSPQELSLTPPMGWANWNAFFCEYNDQTIRTQADALVSTGMRDAGYKYLIIQECIAPERAPNGELIVDQKRFPNGMKSLVDYIHSKGLKAGIYTDVANKTCMPQPFYHGSFNHEEQDAATFANWGMDLIEVDYCNLPQGYTGRMLYERMSAAIKKTGRPMFLYICSWGNERPWEWGYGVGNAWRTDLDISLEPGKGRWNNIVRNFHSNAAHAVFNAPGGWNDADMLVVGNDGVSLEEAQSHFGMWVVSAAPLWASADLTKLDKNTLDVFRNPEVLAIHQDRLGEQAVKIREDETGLEVWSKRLTSKTSGSRAVLLLNINDTPQKISVDWKDLDLEEKAEVRDVWKRKNLGTVSSGYSAVVPAHGTILLKVTGNFSWKRGATFEAEYPVNNKDGNAQLLACSECSEGYAMTLPAVSGTLKFSSVTVSEPGAYELTIHYVRNGSFDPAILSLQVNEAAKIPVTFTGSVNATVTVPVTLRAGENVLSFSDVVKTQVLHIDKINIQKVKK